MSDSNHFPTMPHGCTTDKGCWWSAGPEEEYCIDATFHWNDEESTKHDGYNARKNCVSRQKDKGTSLWKRQSQVHHFTLNSMLTAHKTIYPTSECRCEAAWCKLWRVSKSARDVVVLFLLTYFLLCKHCLIVWLVDEQLHDIVRVEFIKLWATDSQDQLWRAIAWRVSESVHDYYTMHVLALDKALHWKYYYNYILSWDKFYTHGQFFYKTNIIIICGSMHDYTSSKKLCMPNWTWLYYQSHPNMKCINKITIIIYCDDMAHLTKKE